MKNTLLLRVKAEEMNHLKKLKANIEEAIAIHCEENGSHESDTNAFVFDTEAAENYVEGMQSAIDCIDDYIHEFESEEPKPVGKPRNQALFTVRKCSTLTLLLEEFKVPLGARRADEILMEEGIVLDLIRPSMKDPKVFKHFKVLSGKGLPYGRNIPDEAHPVETKMVFYRENFKQLIDNVFERHINPYPIVT